MDIIQRGVEKGLIRFEEERKTITYVNHILPFLYTNPEEPVRAEAFLLLVFQYGYDPKDIEFEVRAKQGSSGKTRADLVVNYPGTKKAFLVVEVKAANTSEKPNEIRKQARSYARSEEINTQLYAYKIGTGPFFAFKTNGKDTETKIPYNYTQQTVYAYLVPGKAIPDNQAHYEALQPSTPYDLKRIFSQCHDTIWQSGEKSKPKALDEFNKLLFLKMYDELEREKKEKHLDTYLFQTSSIETKTQLKERIEKTYQQAISDRKVDGLMQPLNLDEYQIFDIIERMQPLNLLATDKDPKGLAFETFVENYMKGDFGQYFTPRNIVEFMLSVSPIVWDKDFNSTHRVLDPCCGSGSFLTQAISTFRERFRNPKNWQDFANNAIFGVELSEDISLSAKINLALHDDGHDNIKNANGLNTPRFDWKAPNVHLILTNPPFGGEPVENRTAETDKALENLKRFYDYETFEITRKRTDDLDRIRGKAKDSGRFTDSIRPEYIFIELFYKMLVDGGIVEVIVPDSLLTTSTARYVRNFIEEHFRILAVISLPQYTFTHYGAGVKSSILVLKKHPLRLIKRIQASREKYLRASLNEREKELTALEKKKEDLENEYAPIVTVNQWRKQQEEAALNTNLFADKTLIKKELDALAKEATARIKVIRVTSEFKEWKKARESNLNEEIEVVRESIYDTAAEAFKKFETDLNYPVFMAIADHIGYDATGRETPRNELLTIGPELVRFLEYELKITHKILDGRIFLTESQEVFGSRLDPLFHSGSIYQGIQNTPFPFVPLRTIVKYFKTGFAAGQKEQSKSAEGTVQIRPTNMSDQREFIFEKITLISPEISITKEGELLKLNEVLFNNTNSQELVGKTILFNLEGDYFCSNHITRIKTDDSVLNPDYLVHVLNCYQRNNVFFNTCVNWNNQSGINNELLGGIRIPLPPLPTQQAIAEQIGRMRAEARRLQAEALEVLAAAKTEIERMILGE